MYVWQRLLKPIAFTINIQNMGIMCETIKKTAIPTDAPTPDAIQSSSPTTAPSSNQEQDPFYKSTTILEAFWSGDPLKKLPKYFTNYYMSNSKVSYEPGLFIISIFTFWIGAGFPALREIT